MVFKNSYKLSNIIFQCSTLFTNVLNSFLFVNFKFYVTLEYKVHAVKVLSSVPFLPLL